MPGDWGCKWRIEELRDLGIKELRKVGIMEGGMLGG